MDSQPQLGIVRNAFNLDTNYAVEKSGKLSYNSREKSRGKTEDSIRVVEVYIHQARDIHNICIYQNQDVYAKFYLTNDPETTISTRTISGGGKNPVFYETLKLDIRKIDDSLLKCEIWMLSRISNYLENQLLGFATVPLCEIVSNEKLEREFSLSSSDLFHSPAGFVQLSLEYLGPAPHVIETCMPVHKVLEVPKLVPCELAKIEFPNPEIAEENECMVYEYIEILDAKLEVPSFDELVDSVERLKENDFPKIETPQNSVSNTSSKVVQQEIVDMYMKGMQDFTESLAKMKLPLDMDNDSDADSGEKIQALKYMGQNPRVFYGSRAFF